MESTEEGQIQQAAMNPKKPSFPYLKYGSKYIIIWVVAVVVVFVGIFVYAGQWPAFVIVESSSMCHCDEEAQFGVLDAGDMIIAKSIGGRSDIISYMEGRRTDYKTYSEYGDVLIYYKNGYKDINHVLHRALIWVEFNTTTGNSYDVPELRNHAEGWTVQGGPQVWYDLTGTVILHRIGHDDTEVSINLGLILNHFTTYGLTPHSGFITMGDHNRGHIDQHTLTDEHTIDGTPCDPIGGMRVKPVKPEWVMGVARGELPGLGMQTLAFEDSSINDRVPSNIWSHYYLTFGLILIIFVVTPISFYIAEIWVRKKRLKASGGEYPMASASVESQEPIEPSETEKKPPPPPPDKPKK